MASATILSFDGSRLSQRQDLLAPEEPLEIRLRGKPISITMRTPGHDHELAAGFLLTENILSSPADILNIAHCPKNEHDNTLDILLAPHIAVDFAKLTRHVFASSSCGLCGKASIDALTSHHPPISSTLTIDASLLASLPDKMRAAQQTFSQTGGLHAAALFDPAGTLLVLREDVGRHNALDKVIGHCLLNNLPTDNTLLLVSGRTSFEILQKSLAARIPLIAAISAPSSLAVQFAHTAHITLIGFLRPPRFNIYTHPHRLTFP